MPDSTTSHAQVNNACLPAEGRPNNTPIFISRVLAYLRVSCTVGLTAHLKAEKLMVVPSTANGFRAVVSALRSLDGGEGEFSHLYAPGGLLCAASGEEPGQRNA